MLLSRNSTIMENLEQSSTSDKSLNNSSSSGNGAAPAWDVDIGDSSCSWDYDSAAKLAASYLVTRDATDERASCTGSLAADSTVASPESGEINEPQYSIPVTACTMRFRFSRSVHNPRFKTEFCRNFAEKGTCIYGQMCQFAHGRSELRQEIGKNHKYKTKQCQKYWMNGYCAYGPRCNFIHEESFPTSTSSVMEGNESLRYLSHETIQGVGYNEDSYRRTVDIQYDECYQQDVSQAVGNVQEGYAIDNIALPHSGLDIKHGHIQTEISLGAKLYENDSTSEVLGPADAPKEAGYQINAAHGNYQWKLSESPEHDFQAQIPAVLRPGSIRPTDYTPIAMPTSWITSAQSRAENGTHKYQTVSNIAGPLSQSLGDISSLSTTINASACNSTSRSTCIYQNSIREFDEDYVGQHAKYPAKMQGLSGVFQSIQGHSNQGNSYHSLVSCGRESVEITRHVLDKVANQNLLKECPQSRMAQGLDLIEDGGSSATSSSSWESSCFSRNSLEESGDSGSEVGDRHGKISCMPDHATGLNNNLISILESNLARRIVKPKVESLTSKIPHPEDNPLPLSKFAKNVRSDDDDWGFAATAAMMAAADCFRQNHDNGHKNRGAVKTLQGADCKRASVNVKQSISWQPKSDTCAVNDANNRWAVGGDGESDGIPAERCVNVKLTGRTMFWDNY